MLIPNKVNNAFCPHCFKGLNHGAPGFLWCPDIYSCEYEFYGQADKIGPLNQHDMLLKKQAKLKKQQQDNFNDFQKQIDNVELELSNIKK